MWSYLVPVKVKKQMDLFFFEHPEYKLKEGKK